jgi:RimJ/RimL family protein N-acetyltransferase
MTLETDLDLLELHCRWRTPVGSAAAPDEALLGVRAVGGAAGGWRVLPGSTLPDDVRTDVDAALAAERPGPAPSTAVVAAVARASRDGTAPRVHGGPVFVFDPSTAEPPPVPPGVHLVTSEDDGDDTSELPARSWDAHEWRDLLAGRLGPWAAVVDDATGAVASLTHTPKPLLDHAAECGAWTDSDHRGRGLAGLATTAWAALVDAPGRHRFYSVDHRNHASQRVAARLGLRPIGWHWLVDAQPWPVGDAWGDALRSHLRGGWTPAPELEVEGTGAAGPAMHPAWFFRDHDEWDPWERDLFDVVRHHGGPVLDLGAGAGRAARWLQAEGLEVTAVDASPGAVAVCRARGVADARLGDVLDPPSDRRWRAFLLSCGNLGLGGSFDGTRRLLARLAAIAAPDAVLVGDTVDTGEPADLSLRIRYGETATPWWRQRNLRVAEIPAVVEGTGWTLDRHVLALPDHAVLLRRTP